MASLSVFEAITRWRELWVIPLGKYAHADPRRRDGFGNDVMAQAARARATAFDRAPNPAEVLSPWSPVPRYLVIRGTPLVSSAVLSGRQEISCGALSRPPGDYGDVWSALNHAAIALMGAASAVVVRDFAATLPNRRDADRFRAEADEVEAIAAASSVALERITAVWWPDLSAQLSAARVPVAPPVGRPVRLRS